MVIQAQDTIEGAPYPTCQATLRGELVRVNRAMADMLGYDAPSLPVSDLSAIFRPAGDFEEFRQVLLQQGTHPAKETVWVRRDGSSIPVSLSGRAVRSAEGAISHLDIFAENVTEKKRLEAELGGVAHDFNNLLTVIIGHVNMMLHDESGYQRRQSLEAVLGAAERGAALTKQLLSFSGRRKLRSRAVNLNQVIPGLIGILGPMARENIELEFLAGDDLGHVKADPNDIERMVLNLILNARQAMPLGGRITLRTANVPADSPGGECVELVVRDTGIGMDNETQIRAFEPFFTGRPNEGTGLGLSVVDAVVRQNGGHIRLESEPGIGTTFRIYLPRAPRGVLRQPSTRISKALRG